DAFDADKDVDGRAVSDDQHSGALAEKRVQRLAVGFEVLNRVVQGHAAICKPSLGVPAGLVAQKASHGCRAVAARAVPLDDEGLERGVIQVGAPRLTQGTLLFFRDVDVDVHSSEYPDQAYAEDGCGRRMAGVMAPTAPPTSSRRS